MENSPVKDTVTGQIYVSFQKPRVLLNYSGFCAASEEASEPGNKVTDSGYNIGEQSKSLLLKVGDLTKITSALST